MTHDDYEIIFETTAIRDLYGIFNYITDVLKAPHAAQRILLTIEEHVMSIAYMLARHNVMRGEPYASMGVKIMPVENYNALYVVDEPQQEIHILRILYNRREWQNHL